MSINHQQTVTNMTNVYRLLKEYRLYKRGKELGLKLTLEEQNIL